VQGKNRQNQQKTGKRKENHGVKEDTKSTDAPLTNASPERRVRRRGTEQENGKPNLF